MHTAQSLLRRGDTVVGIDNLNDYYDVRLKHARLACLAGQGDFRFIERDIAPTGQRWPRCSPAKVSSA